MSYEERKAAISDGIERSVKNAEKEWLARYEVLCMIFAMNNKVFHGGELCKFCRKRKLWEPDKHNRWVGAVTVLESQGYITKIGEVEPDTEQSHIGSLSLWQSNIYNPIKYSKADIPTLLELAK